VQEEGTTMQSLSHHKAFCHVEFVMMPVEKGARRNALDPLTGSRYRQALHVNGKFRGAGPRLGSGVFPMKARENYDPAGFGHCDGHLRLHGVTIAEQIDGT
jgi:hypothetical protein